MTRMSANSLSVLTSSLVNTKADAIWKSFSLLLDILMASRSNRRRTVPFTLYDTGVVFIGIDARSHRVALNGGLNIHFSSNLA